MNEQLKAKVQNEYTQGLEHVRSERDRKRKADAKILEAPPPGFIKSNLLWDNMQFETATFLTDHLDIALVSEKGVLEDEIVKNAEKVSKFLYRKLGIKKIKRQIIDDNNLYGLAATFIEWFDDDENTPLIGCIDPLSIIPDPKNYADSEMRFIGLEKQVPISYIRDNKNFKYRDEVLAGISEEWRKTEQARGQAFNMTQMPDDEMTSLYFHFTTFEGKKLMTVWSNNFEYCLREVELEGLSKAEKLNPAKVRFPIQLHRRAPKRGSFFGSSLYDELIDYQDLESELLGLKVAGVRLEELGWDHIINKDLGVNLEALQKVKVGNRYIEADFSNIGNQPTFIDVPVSKSSGRVDGLLQQIPQYANKTSGNNDISRGQSAPWTQTKSEVQILEQKADRLLRMKRDNYMDSYEEMWQDILRSYELYMGEKSKINIAFFDNGKAFSQTLTKKQFVTGGNINIYVVSSDEKRDKDNQDFQKLTVSANLLIGNMKPWYAMDSLLRVVIEKSGIDWADPLVFIPESVDEMHAKNNLELLNNNIEVSEPQPNQDLLTYIAIYKQALPTPARDKALESYTNAYIDSKQFEQAQVWQQDSASAAMSMNTINSQANQNPTLWN